MKRLLITGSSSYIGNSLIEWLKQYRNEYIVEKISLRDGSWKDVDFSHYNTVLHLAGIAHVSSNPKQKELYYKVNRDLTIEAAEKAKQDGVKQFIFMSSIIVYGGSVLNNGVIDESTLPDPRDFYGDSKLQAEQGIASLESENFKIVIIRPPMIYGKNSKGNYPKLSKIARISPLFPNVENKKSMLHIDNLCEFIRLLIINEESGLYFPQNKEHVKTSDIAKAVSKTHNKKIILTNFFNPIIKLLVKKTLFFNKIFGNLVYEKTMSNYCENYIINDFQESIQKTEKYEESKVK